MKADEAVELIGKEKAEDQFNKRASVAIAALAMLLAITGLGGSNATKETFNNNVLASNYWSFFQAKNARQHALNIAIDEIERTLLLNPSMPDDAKAAMQRKAEDYRKTIARYESEPSTGEGKKELAAKAKDHEQKRDRALKQDPYFDYSTALLQIAIVLISIAIVAYQRWLAILGGGLGVIGGLLMLNGFYLLVSIPFLA